MAAVTRAAAGDIWITSFYSVLSPFSLLLSILLFSAAMYFISQPGTGAPMRPAFSVIDSASFNKYQTVTSNDSIVFGSVNPKTSDV